MEKRRKINVNAILDIDMEDLLRRANQYDSIIAGNVVCENCGTIITIQNIGIIKPQKNTNNEILLEFYCDRLDCTQNYTNDNGSI
jgi:hypothetical protein